MTGGGNTGTSAPGPMTAQVAIPTAELAPGQTTQAQVALKDASRNVVTATDTTWSTSNETVARVSDKGVVTAVAGGTATVSATIEGVSGGATSPSPTQGHRRRRRLRRMSILARASRRDTGTSKSIRRCAPHSDP